MLLAALAFCLLVALFVHPRRSTPTPTFFSERFHREKGQVVQAAFARLGLKSDACAHGMFQRREWDGAAAANSEIIVFSPPRSQSRAVVGELNRGVREMLTQGGWEVYQRGLQPYDEDMASYAFGHGFRKGDIEGDICVYAMEDPKRPDHWLFEVLIHESRCSPQTER